ncbi:hypothetical protein O0L34_g17649 [Tuta absoluta]|nr:hypothetical protein O0L34_g17649 [Tuta absoluta]
MDMDEIRKMFVKQKEEMFIIKNSIIDEITKNINQKFSILQTRTEIIENKIDEQQILMDRLEQQIKKKNILIYGVEEKEKNYYELEKFTMELIREEIAISTFGRPEIESLHRIGKKSDSKIRPIVLTVTTISRKIEIMRNRSKLQGTNIYLKEDLTTKIMTERKKLQAELKERRDNGENVFLKYDKIVTKKTRNQKESDGERPITRTTKRKQSKSPENLHVQGSQSVQSLPVTNTLKKNKTIASYLFRQSPNSEQYTTTQPQE